MIARLILVPRQDVLDRVVDLYSSRTSFLILGYNEETFTPRAPSDVGLVPYRGVSAELVKRWDFPTAWVGHPLGTTWKTWISAGRMFPDVERWVIHDYDLICRPRDEDLVGHVPTDSYGMIGTPVPRYKPGIDASRFANRTYPFVHSRYERLWYGEDELNTRVVDKLFSVLEREYPFDVNGVTSALCGYGDLVVLPRDILVKLGDPALEEIEVGGIEQVVHCVARAAGYHPVDLSRVFRTRVRFTPMVWFSNKDEIVHPVKDLALVESRSKRFLHGLRLGTRRALLRLGIARYLIRPARALRRFKAALKS